MIANAEAFRLAQEEHLALLTVVRLAMRTVGAVTPPTGQMFASIALFRRHSACHRTLWSGASTLSAGDFVVEVPRYEVPPGEG